MKNTMQKLTAALLAMACVPVTGLTAATVEMRGHWGTTTWADFEGEEPINDHGMVTLGDGAVYEGDEPNMAIQVHPNNNVLRFILRENIDHATVEMQIMEMMDAHFPGLLENYDPQANCAIISEINEQGYKQEVVSLSCWGDGIAYGYQLTIRGADIDKATKELETDILLQLAEQHLITEFYGWGSTGYYTKIYFDDYVLDQYGEKHGILTKNRAGWVYNLGEEDTDWDGVQAYLNEHYPDYAVESYKDTHYTPRYCYRISGVDNLSFRERLELAGELYEHFGIRSSWVSPESGAQMQSTVGHNALERPGDTNLDCEVNILDVIAANKHILGVGTLDKTGLKNADMDGNGTEDSADSLAILKAVLDIAD